MADAVLEHWLGGRGLSESQLNPLGVRVPDPDDGAWVYGRFVENGTYNFGRVVRHAGPNDLQGNAAGVFASGNSPIGSDKLIDSGQFANATRKDVQGALGMISDGAGEGQQFWVVRAIDNNTLQIAVLAAGAAAHRGTGWVEALTGGSTANTHSRYRLRLPGYFYRSTDGNDANMNAGAYQGDQLVVTDDYKPYGWVKCEGTAFVMVDAVATGLAQGGFVEPGANGVVVTTSFGNSIGRTLIGEAFGNTADHLTQVSLHCPNWGISRRNVAAGERHAHNRVNIGV